MFASRVVDVVEAAYSLEGTDEAWLTELARATDPALGRGLGIIGYIGKTSTLRAVAFAAVNLAQDIVELLATLARSNPTRATALTYQSAPLRLSCLSRDPLFSEELRPYLDAAGFVDGIGLYAHGADGNSVHLFAPSPVIERPNRRMSRVWERVASHIAAAHRLRARLSDSARVDAVLDPSGCLHDATEETALAREGLRQAVKLRERARTRQVREDGERALAMWQGLVLGKWSLVDRWESDGKRFIAAVENQPKNLDPRALRPREGAAARLAAEGAASKDIAYALGISPSNARTLLASALTKLGLSSRTELLRFRPSQGHVLESGEYSTLVLPEERLPSHHALTPAEQQVAELAAVGMSNAEIARLRGTSVRTVANQMAAILDKLAVHSRADILRASVRRSAIAAAPAAEEGHRQRERRRYEHHVVR